MRSGSARIPKDRLGVVLGIDHVDARGRDRDVVDGDPRSGDPSIVEDDRTALVQQFAGSTLALRGTGNGVDLKPIAGTSGQYRVSDAVAGEWIEYTVDVATAGEYTVDFRVGHRDGGSTFRLQSVRDGQSPAEALEFAVAASCLKHTVPGDFNKVTKGEVQALLAGDASGRVVR